MKTIVDAPSGIVKEKLDFLLNDTFSGEWSIFAEILELFLSDTPVSVTKIEKTYAEGNTQEVISVAHRLRSNALNVGAVHFAWICAELESEGRDGKFENFPKFIQELRKECPVVMTVLSDVLRKGDPKVGSAA